MEALDHISYSHLNLALCPYAAFLRYEGGIRGPGTVYLALGNALHAVLERAHKDQAFHLPAWVDEFKREFNRIIDEEEIFAPFPLMKKSETNGINMLEIYHGQIESGEIQKTPLAVEKDFSIPIYGTNLVGRIDKIEHNHEGADVIDYKSGAAKPDPWFLRKDIQLTCYYWAHYEMYGFYPRRLGWHHLRTGEILWTERTPEDIEDVKIRIKNILAMREAGIRHRAYNKMVCGDGSGRGIQCDYRGSICDDRDLEKKIAARIA